MHKENELNYIVSIYGNFFLILREYGLINKDTAYPVKLKGDKKNQKNEDAIAVYKWLAEKVKGISEPELQKRVEEFNKIVRALQDKYFLNQFLMALFMLEQYLIEASSTYEQNMILPKVTRLISNMRNGIKKMNEDKDAQDIIIDSSQAASNIWRMFNNKAQLTKEMREARIAMWKEAARKRPKDLKTKYSLEG